MKRNADFNMLAQVHGIVMPYAMDYMPEEYKYNLQMAQDAQPTLITAPNAGIPSILTTLIDPEVIRIFTTPTKAAQIVGGETKKGDWTTATEMFQIVEPTGETSSYGDYSENGMSNVNVGYVSRQSYLFQTFVKYGELEMERAGLAKLNLKSELDVAAAITLNRFLNRTYFYGVAGIQNYGLLNDPKLSTPITPSPTGTGSGTTWATKDGAAIYADIVMLFGQLVAQSKGVIDMTAPMTLALSPAMSVNLTKTNQFNVNVMDQIKKNFPNITVETAVEYETTAGQLVQLIATSVNGMKTAICGFNEKSRDHALVPGSSFWSQKKTGGTWGTIIRNPYAIAQLLGI